jgi:hypothetical protein
MHVSNFNTESSQSKSCLRRRGERKHEEEKFLKSWHAGT